MKTKHAFTLIELLIVVAIIAILAAIAVPNFLEAQVRSKVSRTKNDMRSLATAMESYRLDYNKYPADPMAYNQIFGIEPYRTIGASIDPLRYPFCYSLTTPVPYLASLPEDSFPDRSWDRLTGPYYFGYTGWYAKQLAFSTPDPTGLRKDTGTQWLFLSYGPDRIASECQDLMYGEAYFYYQAARTAQTPNFNQFRHAIYDATNGTISNGDIVRMGP